MDVEVKWEKSSDQIVKERTRGNDGLLFLANEAKRLMDLGEGDGNPLEGKGKRGKRD